MLGGGFLFDDLKLMQVEGYQNASKMEKNFLIAHNLGSYRIAVLTTAI